MFFARLVATLCLVLPFSNVALAQNDGLLEKTYTGTTTEAEVPVVRRKITTEAYEKVSEEIIKELIGQDRYNKNKSLIKDKIIKNSSRYIPFTKPSDVKTEEGKSSMSVAMKISLKDLKVLLLNNNLLIENMNSPIVLPMITVQDKISGESFRWWNKTDTKSGFVVKEARLIETQMKSAFMNNGFHLLSAVEAGLGEQIPSDFKSDRPSSEDVEFMSQRFSAPVILEGVVSIAEGSDKKKYDIEIKVTATLVSNGSVIADISRKFETSGNAYETAVDKKLASVLESAANDLAVQIADAWQRGTVGTSVLSITLRGRQNLKDLEDLKKTITAKIPQVKAIRERLISADMTTYEVDTNLSSNELGAKLNGLQTGNSTLRLEKESGNEVLLRWVK